MMKESRVSSTTKKEDFQDIREFLAKLSELSENMAEQMKMPKRFKKNSDEKLDAVISQAVIISESFAVVEALLKDIGIISGMEG